MRSDTTNDQPSGRPEFLVTSHVTAARDGPLFLTYVIDNHLHVIKIFGGQPSVRTQLRERIPIARVVESVAPRTRKIYRIPIASLVSVTWSDFQSAVDFRYDDESKVRRVRSHIHSSAKRSDLLQELQNRFPRTFRYEEEPAGLFTAAWSNLLGAAVSLAGTVFIQATWDPPFFQRLNGGWLALLLGRTGCVIVGLGFFFGCCYYAYKVMSKKPRVYRCLI